METKKTDLVGDSNVALGRVEGRLAQAGVDHDVVRRELAPLRALIDHHTRPCSWNPNQFTMHKLVRREREKIGRFEYVLITAAEHLELYEDPTYNRISRTPLLQDGELYAKQIETEKRARYFGTFVFGPDDVAIFVSK